MRIDYFEVTQRAKKKYAQMMEPICSRWNLTRNELDVLLFLHNNPEYDRAADIVAHRGLVKSHVSLSVGELEIKGLLLRSPAPEDRRAVHLKLTESGHKIADQGREVQKNFFSCIFAGLSHDDIVLWQQMMEQVCRNIDNWENV